jgi:hypothetical protein
MLSSEMLCHVALVRTDVSEKHIISIIRVIRIGKLATKALCEEMMEAIQNRKTNSMALSLQANYTD